MSNRMSRCGFSLVEVNLAIFVISVGMLTLFSLFPSGLRQVEDSQKATQEALFADYVLSSLRAESRHITAENWGDITLFRESILSILSDIPVANTETIQEVTFGSDDQHMRFLIEFREVGANRRSVTLWCQASEFGPTGSAFRNRASRFYTEFAYSGMP